MRALLLTASLACALPLGAAPAAQARPGVLCRDQRGATGERAAGTHRSSRDWTTGDRGSERTWVVSWSDGACSLDVHARGGVRAVLGEISLVTTDHARRIYFTTLLATGRLNAGDLRRVLAQAGREI